LSASVFPTIWKLSKIIPVYKAGPLSDVNNFRPIAILCAVSKILERYVCKFLVSHIYIITPCPVRFSEKPFIWNSVKQTYKYVGGKYGERFYKWIVFNIDLRKAFFMVDRLSTTKTCYLQMWFFDIVVVKLYILAM
jgi:hypothetical protein